MPAPESVAASPLPPIICLGASAGGLRALETFFHQMPTHSGCSFVVVQHLSPDFRSLMDDLLRRQTTMKIHRVEDGMLIEPDSVYLIPAKKIMTVQGGRLTLTERGSDRAAVRNSDLPINVFLCSLAVDAGPRAVAIILSGTGSDGTEGVLAVHQAGGLVIVQDPDTAEFDGMPRSAIATGIADYELAPEKMPEFVLAYARDHTTRLAPPERNTMASVLDEDSVRVPCEFAAIFTLLKRGFGIDFSHYKIATVERRIHRRMAILEVKQLGDYATLLSTKPDELNSLYCDLLIGVTEFFRDPEAFAALRELVYAPLLRTADREECRIWIAGCATGEEAYSHAMLLDEIANELGYTGRMCIFATDAHRNSLETASAGIYSRDRLANVSPERLSTYFRAEKNDTFRIRSDLRQRIVFAPHNLLNDPPFTKLDVVSCRNLLIYLSPQAQERCISLFHYALRRDAVMMLGLSEGLGRLVNDFEALDTKQKLYRKTRESRLPLDLRSGNLTRPGRAPIATASPHAHISPSTLPRGLLNAYDQLLKQYLPSGFILSEEANILHYIGDSGRFLPSVSGRAQDSILSRTSGDLRLALSTLIPKVLRDRAPAESRGLNIELSNGSCEIIDLAVNPLTEDRSGAILLHVSLRNPRPPLPLPTIDAVSGNHTYTASEAFATQQAHTRRIVDLELELSSTKESLQATVEELQTTNEELKAANEEMLAANEELQSTNEELHSVNEELYTVNAELESKNNDLKRLNADLDNLLKATNIGTLFLDRSLSIRMFNPSIEMIFHLMPQDIGRPIEHIAYHLAEQSSMIEEIRSVLATGTPIEGEVRTRDGHWLLKRILPFYATHRAIEGVVLTFTSIDKIKSVQNKLDLAMLSARLVWWEWELPNGRFSTHSNGACILGYQVGELPSKASTWFTLTHPADLDRVRASLDACLQGKTPDWDCEHRYRDAKGRWRWVHEKGRITERAANGTPLRMIGTTQDIHARRSAESELAKLSLAIDQMDIGMIITDTAGRIEYVNPCFTQTTGFASAEVIGKTPRILKSDQTPPAVHEQLWQTILRGESWRGEMVNRCKDGRLITERISISPVKDSLDNITHFIGVREDITVSKQEQAHRTRLENQLAQSQKMETLGTLAGGIAHDFNNLLTSIHGYTTIASASIPPDHKIKPLLKQIDQAGMRGGDLVRRILAFSRHHTPIHQPVMLSQLYADTLPLLRASLPSTIELSLVDKSNNGTVLGDSTHLQQVLFNLCTNAAHSIGTQAGQIVITLERITLATPPETIVGKLTEGTYLRLIVADNGQGISKEVLARIFEPFFTTKPVGQGTGLGLSIIQNTLVAHKGAIAVHSTLSKGSTFTLYFPVVATPAPLIIDAPPPAPGTPDNEAPRGNGERIMVIDDDTSIAEINVMALTEAGYQPSNMGSAAECLAALQKTPGAADLIITDQTMPGMTGLELAYALRAAGNRIPILITSGYNRVITPESMAALGLGFISKPFNIEDLLIETRRMLAPMQK